MVWAGGLLQKWVHGYVYYVPLARGNGCAPGEGGPGGRFTVEKPSMIRKTYEMRAAASSSQSAYDWEAGTFLPHSRIPQTSAGRASASLGGSGALSSEQ